VAMFLNHNREESFISSFQTAIHFAGQVNIIFLQNNILSADSTALRLVRYSTVEQNRRQKVFNRGALGLCGGAWHSKN